jgi:hypothetical protein
VSPGALVPQCLRVDGSVRLCARCPHRGRTSQPGCDTLHQAVAGEAIKAFDAAVAKTEESPT